jgi:hypothetical protein
MHWVAIRNLKTTGFEYLRSTSDLPVLTHIFYIFRITFIRSRGNTLMVTHESLCWCVSSLISVWKEKASEDKDNGSFDIFLQLPEVMK